MKVSFHLLSTPALGLIILFRVSRVFLPFSDCALAHLLPPMHDLPILRAYTSVRPRTCLSPPCPRHFGSGASSKRNLLTRRAWRRRGRQRSATRRSSPRRLSLPEAQQQNERTTPQQDRLSQRSATRTSGQHRRTSKPFVTKHGAIELDCSGCVLRRWLCVRASSHPVMRRCSQLKELKPLEGLCCQCGQSTLTGRGRGLSWRCGRRGNRGTLVQVPGGAH